MTDETSVRFLPERVMVVPPVTGPEVTTGRASMTGRSSTTGVGVLGSMIVALRFAPGADVPDATACAGASVAEAPAAAPMVSAPAVTLSARPQLTRAVPVVSGERAA